MLTPEYLSGVSEPIQRIFSDLQTIIQEDIARRIKKAKYQKIPDTAAWQITKLQELGESQKNIQRYIAQTLQLSDKQVRELFKKAGLKSLKTDAALQQAAIAAGKLPAGVVPLTASPAIAQVLTANARRTMNTLERLTGSTANVASGKLHQYLDMAQMMTQSGAYTQEEAIEAAVKKFAADGVTHFEYLTGRRISMDAGVRRAVTTGVNQAIGEVSLANAQELGTDLVEVTSHADARPEHALWQGGIYSISGKHPRYKSLRTATGYGTVAGLKGANCRHDFFPFLEGISEQLPRETYDPQTYQDEQKQRAMERAIRSWKRRAITLDAGGVDNTKELLKVKEWQDKLDKHLAATGLARISPREQVPGFGHSLSSKATQAAKKAARIKNGGFNTSSIKQGTVAEAQNWATKTLGIQRVNYTGLPLETANTINRSLKRIYDEYPVLKGFLDDIKVADIPAVARAGIFRRDDTIRAYLTLSAADMKSPDKIRQLVNAHVKSQFWSPKNGLEGIIKHECAHLLEYQYTLKKYGILKTGSASADIDRAFDAARKFEVAAEIKKSALKSCNLADERSIIQTNLSKYANEEDGEFLAEALSEYQPRRLAKMVQEMFKQLLGV